MRHVGGRNPVRVPVANEATIGSPNLRPVTLIVMEAKRSIAGQKIIGRIVGRHAENGRNRKREELASRIEIMKTWQGVWRKPKLLRKCHIRTNLATGLGDAI